MDMKCRASGRKTVAKPDSDVVKPIFLIQTSCCICLSLTFATTTKRKLFIIVTANRLQRGFVGELGIKGQEVLTPQSRIGLQEFNASLKLVPETSLQTLTLCQFPRPADW